MSTGRNNPVRLGTATGTNNPARGARRDAWARRQDCGEVRMNPLCDWFIDADLIVEHQQRLLHEATCMTGLSAHDGQGACAVRSGHWRQWL